ncbi:hypothetical protein [Arsenophonus nasoniae]|uniref:Uncharacterized protein n=1 Tax=Arsenophonus nasoniae TaxID=638 RepID=A0AA95GCZ7_9GAMM|nr:hypothetical protein [Arsenophonus nasoniae]WGL93910.1 hypothetical protein QE207_00780 [Arsenophonus nasoniae]
MNRFEELDSNPQKTGNDRIHLYLHSANIGEEIGEQISPLIAFGVHNISIQLLYVAEIEDVDVVIEFSYQSTPEFSPNDEVYVFDETKTDADMGDELFNRLLKLKKGTEIRIQKQEIL